MTRVGVHAYDDVSISAPVTVNGGSLTVVADAHCSGVGTFTLSGSGSIDTNSNSFWLQTADIDLRKQIDTGSQAFHLIGCSGIDIDVGGNGLTTTGDIKISQSELQKIKSTNLTFNTESGSIYVYKTVSQHTTSVTDCVTLNADKSR